MIRSTWTALPIWRHIMCYHLRWIYTLAHGDRWTGSGGDLPTNPSGSMRMVWSIICPLGASAITNSLFRPAERRQEKKNSQRVGSIKHQRVIWLLTLVEIQLQFRSSAVLANKGGEKIEGRTRKRVLVWKEKSSQRRRKFRCRKRLGGRDVYKAQVPIS